jgi:lipoic acid synthetase
MPQPVPGWLMEMVRQGKKVNACRSHLYTASQIEDNNLNTVCEGARCPNRGNCYSRGTATFMILGNICTRKCTFCAVEKGVPGKQDEDEPCRLARVAYNLKLSHVVVTSVTRDDLPDGGAGQFALVVRELHHLESPPSVEVLTPDFKGSTRAIKTVVDTGLEVYGHNVETVPRLYRQVRPGAKYSRSLDLLAAVRRMNTSVITKSGLMLGLGETEKEVRQVLADLLSAGVGMLTVGQYLAPSLRHYPVQRYITLEEFKQWEKEALSMGFKSVASAPLVRSSYHAGDYFREVTAHG